MLKHFAAAFFMLSTAASALAQNPKQHMRFRDVERPRSQFSHYLMKGFSAGLEYSALDSSAKLTFKNSATGTAASVTGETTASAGALGVSVTYGQMRRSDFGFMAGLGLIKKLEDNRENGNSLTSSGPMLQVRPEGNLVYSFSNGLYGAAGANISYVDIQASDDVISKVGLGLQAQIGFIPTRNLGMDVGYYISRHNFNEMWTESNGVRIMEIDSNQSYVDFKQIRARVSYLF